MTCSLYKLQRMWEESRNPNHLRNQAVKIVRCLQNNKEVSSSLRRWVLNHRTLMHSWSTKLELSLIPKIVFLGGILSGICHWPSWCLKWHNYIEEKWQLFWHETVHVVYILSGLACNAHPDIESWRKTISQHFGNKKQLVLAKN